MDSELFRKSFWIIFKFLLKVWYNDKKFREGGGGNEGFRE